MTGDRDDGARRVRAPVWLQVLAWLLVAGLGIVVIAAMVADVMGHA